MAPRPGYKSIASGRVSKDRQIYLSIVAFGSVLWIVALISLAAPGFGTFLLTFVTLPVFAPVLKGRNLARRWETQHVPMLVKPDDYLTVVEEVQAALRAGGVPTTRARATWILRLPTKFLSLFARYAMATVAADHLTRLVAPEVEILLHPSDLVISERERAATRTRAAAHRPVAQGLPKRDSLRPHDLSTRLLGGVGRAPSSWSAGTAKSASSGCPMSSS